MKLVQQWWRQPDRYPWLVGYLETRGVQTWARIMMCLFALVVIDALSAEADAAMYEAKRAGGNQFRVRVNPPLP